MSNENLRDEHELMSRCAAGEEAPFEELVSRYQQPIVDYLTRLIGNVSRAEELGQEVFVRIFQHRLDYTAKAKFSTWCYTIATNIARDERRANARRPSNTGAEALEFLSSEQSDPYQNVERKERSAIIRKALDKIPEHLRESIILRDIQGCSYQEIAEVLQLEIGTVKSRINRARLAFKEIFITLSGIAHTDMEEMG